MKKFIAFLLTLCLMLPLIACTKSPETAPDPETVSPNADKLVFFENGTSNYRIIIPADSNDYSRIATQLHGFLYRITGFDFPILPDTEAETEYEILLGQTNRTADDVDVSDLGEEGFVIHQADKRICITGGGVRGTLYGVYEFLESELDCILLTQEHSVIPKQKSILLDPIAENRQTPGFEWRRHSHTWVDSLLSRTNCSWGGSTKEFIGGEYTYARNEVCHTFGPLLNWSKSQSYHKQPCLTDEEVYQKMLANARLWMEDDPSVEIISITQNDAAPQDTGECTCDNCKASNEKYGASGTMLNFVNRIAAELAVDYPNLKIETLAYIHTEEAPKGGVVPADNVMIRFCTMAGCIMHSLTGEDRSQTNVYPANTNKHYKNLLAWSEITDNIYIWEYDINFGSIFTCFPNFQRLYENLHFYHEIGVKGVFVQGMGETGEFDHLRAYLCTQLLWNPDMSYEEYCALIEKFAYAYYGEGGGDILAAIDLLKTIMEGRHPSMYHDMSRHYPLTKNEDGTADRTLCNQLLGHFESAYEKARTNIERKRVERSMITALYYQSILCGMDIANGKSDINEMIAINERIYDIMDRNGLAYYREGFTIPKNPNFKNTLYYWNLGGEGIFNSSTEAAYNKTLKNN